MRTPTALVQHMPVDANELSLWHRRRELGEGSLVLRNTCEWHDRPATVRQVEVQVSELERRARIDPVHPDRAPAGIDGVLDRAAVLFPRS